MSNEKNTKSEASALLSDPDPYNELLKEWKSRERMIGRDTASHPITLKRILNDLDSYGCSEAGDAIQSLVFEIVIARNRAERLQGR